MSGPKTPGAREIYGDIIGLPHHQSSKHKHMSLHDRAAQFAPFAALVGYDEMVGEEARLTDRQVSPGESDLDRLDRIFRSLSSELAAGRRPSVSALVFIPDSRKAGGRYETVTGRAKRLDPVAKKLILLSGEAPSREITLNMDRILDLSAPDTEDPG